MRYNPKWVGRVQKYNWIITIQILKTKDLKKYRLDYNNDVKKYVN